MKNKKFSKKITLKKTTIANLGENSMDKAKGGKTQLCVTLACTVQPCFTFDTNCSQVGGNSCTPTCSPTVCGMYCVE